MVALNDAILGTTEETEFTLGELDRTIENRIWLAPLTETRSGAGFEIIVPAENAEVIVPLAPDTGRAI